MLCWGSFWKEEEWTRVLKTHIAEGKKHRGRQIVETASSYVLTVYTTFVSRLCTGAEGMNDASSLERLTLKHRSTAFPPALETAIRLSRQGNLSNGPAVSAQSQRFSGDPNQRWLPNTKLRFVHGQQMRTIKVSASPAQYAQFLREAHFTLLWSPLPELWLVK